MRKKRRGRQRNRISEYNGNGTGTETDQLEHRKVRIEPKSIGQRNYLNSIENNKLTICYGPAGTGKTIIAVASAVKFLRENDRYDHIVIVRPAVTACDEKLGYLPGDADAKMGPFMMPILYNLSKIVGKEYYHLLIKHDAIKIIPLAFMRGLTLDNCVAILDEAQNTTPEQMKMFLTRIGEDCKVIVEGDPSQTDIRQENGLVDALNRLTKMRDVGIVELDRSEIVRSGFVSQIVERYEE